MSRHARRCWSYEPDWCDICRVDGPPDPTPLTSAGRPPQHRDRGLDPAGERARPVVEPRHRADRDRMSLRVGGVS